MSATQPGQGGQPGQSAQFGSAFSPAAQGQMNQLYGNPAFGLQQMWNMLNTPYWQAQGASQLPNPYQSQPGGSQESILQSRDQILGGGPGDITGLVGRVNANQQAANQGNAQAGFPNSGGSYMPYQGGRGGK